MKKVIILILTLTSSIGFSSEKISIKQLAQKEELDTCSDYTARFLIAYEADNNKKIQVKQDADPTEVELKISLKNVGSRIAYIELQMCLATIQRVLAQQELGKLN
ncbi:MAG: hypothetical protein Q7U04_06890 [Bacteriovorax sp.]|nr:hypothetical protein [Bacteriovorax sp.]